MKSLFQLVGAGHMSAVVFAWEVCCSTILLHEYGKWSCSSVWLWHDNTAAQSGGQERVELDLQNQDLGRVMGGA